MEVEIKIKIEDPNPIKEKILAGGGKKTEEGFQHDVYYDDGKGFFKSGNTLRIRTGTNKPLLTSKQCPVDHNEHVLSRPEFQTELEDADAMDKILQSIGFKPHVVKEKKYENYEFDGVIVEFHNLPFLGDFIEIEAPEEELKEVLPKIGLSVEMGLSKGYDRLFDEYKKEHNLASEVQDSFDEEKKYGTR
ncbi:MAG TPA: class IV adenylate cyclase [Candidatus Binatia bacterium]|nr:class IV adenylate cyclase [Candidatus Binatia bacterium]